MSGTRDPQKGKGPTPAETKLNIALGDAPHLYPITFEKMEKLIYLKHASAAKKGKDFNCYTIHFSDLNKMLDTLKNNLANLPDGFRIQLAIQHVSLLGEAHWMLIDIFKDNDTLKSFVVDAPNKALTTQRLIFQTVDLIQETIPSMINYLLWIPIQYSLVDCQTFVREQAGILAKTNPIALYKALEQEVSSEPFMFNTPQLKYLYRPDLLKQKELAPLFRNIQSLSTAKSIQDAFKEHLVSSKNISLDDWINKHTQMVKDEKKGEVEKNVGIRYKDAKYAEELAKFSGKAPNLYLVGLGYIQVLSKFQKKLENANMEDIKKIINELQKQLAIMPKFSGSTTKFFGIKSDYFSEGEVLNRHLAGLLKSCDNPNIKKIFLLADFKMMVGSFLGFLIRENSKTANSILKNLTEVFNQLLNKEIEAKSVPTTNNNQTGLSFK